MRCFTEQSKAHNENFIRRRGKMNASLDEVGSIFVAFIEIRS